jgi:acetyl esterase/lipase
MLVSSRLAVNLSALALAAVTAALVLAGCSQVGTQSIIVVPQRGATYRQFQTYPNVPVVPNVQYDTVEGKAVRLDICLPPATKGAAITPRPAVLAIHGGSWALGDKSGVQWRSICQWLAKSGYVAASVDYGLAPKYVYPTAIDEIEHAVEWLRSPTQVKRYSIDPTLIGVFGGSAGGNLAALVVLHWSLAPERIPLSQSSSFVAKLRANGIAVTFVTVEGELHSIDMLDEAMRTRIAAFLHATLVHTLIDTVK